MLMCRTSFLFPDGQEASGIMANIKRVPKPLEYKPLPSTAYTRLGAVCDNNVEEDIVLRSDAGGFGSHAHALR
jgi:hypothetical protein